MTSRNGILQSELDGGVKIVKIIDKRLQFLWTFTPDHENIVDKS